MIKRKISIVLAIAMSLSIFAGCANKKEDTKATSGEATTAPSTVAKLKIVNFGDTTPRRVEFFEKDLHDKLVKELNVDLTVQFLPWGSPNVDLMYASGENFSTFDGPGPNVAKGFLAEIPKESIDKYLQNLNAIVMPSAWDGAKQNGKIYAIPFGKMPYAGNYQVITVRQDLLDEVGISNLKTIEDIDNAFKAVKAKHPDYTMIPEPAHVKKMFRAVFEPKQLMTALDDSAGRIFTYVDSLTKDDKVYSFFESDLFKNEAKQMGKWKEQGYVNQNMLTNPTQGLADWNAGKALLNRGTAAYPMEQIASMKAKVATATLKNYQIGSQPLMTSNRDNVKYAISSGGAKFVDRYLQVFDWMFKSQENQDFLTYGIKDKDYKLDSAGKVEKVGVDQFYDGWQLFNLKFGRYLTTVPDSVIEGYKKNDDGSIEAKSMGFTFDATNVKTELAKLDAVYTEKIKPIEYGLVDYDKNFPSALQALKDAGLDKYVAEMQKQFTAWSAANKK